VRQSHVWYWLNRSDGAPARYVLAIERATEGRVRRHELRPELYEASAGAEGVVVVNEQ
jgi:DNA-binding transcriptional regulator YdaS (Cro superfamily)